MKNKIIKLLSEHLGDRKEPDIQSLVIGLDKLNESELRGLGLLVVEHANLDNKNKIVNLRNKIKNDNETAYNRKD